MDTLAYVDTFDVTIVGGGPAGLSAALILGRCRRRVLLCDSGSPRNAPATAIHGFLTRDGMAPAEFLRLGCEQLRKYPNVEMRSIEVVDASRSTGTYETTNVKGVYVAGDASRLVQLAIVAASEGAQSRLCH